MANVLVTGSSGFVGGHLVPTLLARGDRVACLVRKASPLEGLRRLPVEFVCGDVTDPESLAAAVAGKEVVYHLAGRVIADDVANLYRVNEQGPRNVAAECARQPDPPAMVMVSSLAASGPSTDGSPQTEDASSPPISHYGRSKLAGERAARAFADRVPITVVRPPVLFGEGDRYCLPLFRMIARFGLHVAPSFSPLRFSFLHADDLAGLLVSAAERGERLTACGNSDSPCSARGIYYASAGEDVSYHEWGRMIGGALGRRRTHVISTGPLVVWTTAALSELAGRLRHHPNFFGLDKAREARAGHWTCSPQKAAAQLDFAAACPLAERLRQTAAWYRREGWL